MSNENISRIYSSKILPKSKYNNIMCTIQVVRRLIVPRLYKIIKIIVIHLQTEMYRFIFQYKSQDR